MLMPAALDVETIRRAEFARLDAAGCTYLDYAGAALYPTSLVRRHATRLTSTVLGNPHSESRPSIASTAALERARRATLWHLGADPGDYDVVFTANATAAIRILAEAFPFQPGSRLVLTADNHNSVNGLRVAARRRRAAIAYVPLGSDLRSEEPWADLPPPTAASLFAFPAQSNFSGVRHPLAWVRRAREAGYRVLLDAAGLVGTAPLSLADIPADFVALSFYKMFGYPTGVGALVARREALLGLRRRYFGGGTVQFVSVQHRRSRRLAGSVGLEDGTPDFLAMPAVCDGLRWLRQIGLSRIERHVSNTTARLLDGLRQYGERVVLYGPADTCARGGVVAFNLRADDRLLPFEDVVAAARDAGIALRGGCFCNPGAAEQAFSFPAARTRACLNGPFSIPRFRDCLGGGAVGAVRASVGLATTERDIARLLAFVGSIVN
jgi:selenocysteine lyase/cysteine desulfurase